MNRNYINIFKELDTGSEIALGLLNILNAELSLPNIPLPVKDDTIWWDNLIEYNGWRLQQNTFTRSARILNSDNVRIAWGTINGMKKVLDRMDDFLHSYQPPIPDSTERINRMEELKKLKELLDIHAITKEEYLEKKQKIMEQL